MSREKRDRILTDLKQELTSIEGRAKEVSKQLESLQREVEPLKVDYLQHYLDKRRKEIARGRGFASFIRDKKMMRNSLLVAAGSLILGGLITRDKFTALHTGLSAFDGALQALGEARWFVSLSKKIAVAPENSLSPEGIWVTWESLNRAMKGLKDKAVVGEKLGNLDNVIFKLKREKLVYFGLPVAKPDSSKEQNFK